MEDAGLRPGRMGENVIKTGVKVMCGMYSIGSRTLLDVGNCGYDDEPRGSIKSESVSSLAEPLSAF